MIRPIVRPLLATLVLLSACKAQKDAFYNKVFTCDPSVAGACGTTEAGDPMVCYSAETLGGTGFCTETCDPDSASMARSGVVCAAVTLSDADAGVAASGAVLTECAPSADACPDGLSCYRTGLTEDTGVCLAMPVCATSAECLQPGTKCAADIVKGAVPPAVAPMLATDHLHCLTVGCWSGKKQCGPREGCIGSYFNFYSVIDELCVPSCDLQKACPPNFTCLQNAQWAPGASPICFPGMLGSRCAEADDCLMGVCTDVGVEFNVCTIPCAHNEECAALNTTSDVYYCSNGHCLTPRPFQGSNCAFDTDCIEGQRCVGATFIGTMKHGECRVPCDADGKCAPRGGLPHICLGENGEGLCYPSSIGLPCDTQADCLATFKCLPAAPDMVRSPQTAYATHICTIPCTTHADCDANSYTKKNAFCQDGICRLAGGDGAACSINEHCVSNICAITQGSIDPDKPKSCQPQLTTFQTPSP